MDRVLVTGGAGFIGSCFVRRAITEGAFHVVNLDKLTYAGNLESLDGALRHQNHDFVCGDVCDAIRLRSLFDEKRPVAVVHFAAESHVDRSIDGPGDFLKTNVIGTFTLLEAARAYWSRLSGAQRSSFRFVHVSTDEVYGSLGTTGRFSETSPYRPNSPYAATKAAADHLVRSYCKTYGLPTIITSCSNNYGPYQFPEKLIPLMVLNALEGKPLPVYGDGGNVRDWLYVEDHCSALCRVLEGGVPGEVYNIGGGAEKTNLEVVQMICDTVDQLCPDLPHGPCRSLITFVEDRPGHDYRYAIDATKIAHALQWLPTRTFEKGLEQTVQWYLENRDWADRVSSGVYSGDRIGLMEINRAESTTVDTNITSGKGKL